MCHKLILLVGILFSVDGYSDIDSDKKAKACAKKATEISKEYMKNCKGNRKDCRRNSALAGIGYYISCVEEKKHETK